MKVIALKNHGYRGKRRKKGTEYYIENVNHVKILGIAKAVAIVKETTDKKEPVDIVKKESVKKSVKKIKQEPKKITKETSRIYKRKDMQADDSSKKTYLKRDKHEQKTVKD